MFSWYQRLKFTGFNSVAPLALISMIAVSSSLTPAQAAESGETASGAYKANCAICHSDDGSGTPLGIRLHAKDLRSKEVQAKSSEELAQTIRTGKDNMPAFGSRLDNKEIDDLVEYIRTKKPKRH
jgi:mono/diheme cytochrome c family protein